MNKLVALWNMYVLRAGRTLGRMERAAPEKRAILELVAEDYAWQARQIEHLIT